MILLLCIAIVILIAFSAFFSASEMVFSSANILRLENAAEDSVPGAKLALRIIRHFDDTLSSILVGNNLVNIATSSIGSVIAVTLWGEKWTWLMTLLLTVAVIIFGETMPKIVAKKNANRFALILCYPIRFLSLVLKPVTVIIVGLVNLIMKLLPQPNTKRSEDEAHQEFQSIIETAEDEHVLDEDESELLQAALDFYEISVQEVMTARVDVTAVDIEDPLDELLNLAEQSIHSRLPVYQESPDQILGILDLNELYKALIHTEKPDITSLLQEPIYLYKTTKLPDALDILQFGRQRLGIVVDEYGGTMGIVTVEDIMEELVGEIWDENDIVEAEEIIEYSDTVFELDGDVPISVLTDLMDWKESELDIESATVGGLTTEIHGMFPKEGDLISFQNAEFKVLEMEPRRVRRVLVTVINTLS